MTHSELVWYFSTVRWLPLCLLTAIGVTDLLMQPELSNLGHWVFFFSTIVLGILLFKLGCLLMTCNQTKRYAKQRVKLDKRHESSTEFFANLWVFPTKVYKPLRNFAASFQGI